MKNKLCFLFIAVIAAMLESCLTTYYFDAAKYFKDKSYKTDKPFMMKDGNIYAPLLSKKGEFNINTDVVDGCGVQTALAVSSDVEIIAGASYVSNSDSKNQNTSVPVQVTDGNGTHYDSYSGNYRLEHTINQQSFNIALGKYKTFGKAGRWEKLAGFAAGSAENNYTYVVTNDNSHSSNSWRNLNFNFNYNTYHYEYPFSETRYYYQGFLQGNLGYVTRKTEGAFITRLSYIHFNTQTFTESYEMKKYVMSSDNIVLEPALKFGFGGKHFRVYSQVGFNIPLSRTDLQWYSTNVQAGVIFRINN